MTDDLRARLVAHPLLDQPEIVKRMKDAYAGVTGKAPTTPQASEICYALARVATDVVVGLLDEIDDERANYGGAMADLHALVEVARRAVAMDASGRPNSAIAEVRRFLDANYPEPAPAPGAAAEPDRVVDMMADLEDSVAAAKEARSRHPQPRPGGRTDG